MVSWVARLDIRISWSGRVTGETRELEGRVDTVLVHAFFYGIVVFRVGGVVECAAETSGCHSRD